MTPKAEAGRKRTVMVRHETGNLKIQTGGLLALSKIDIANAGGTHDSIMQPERILMKGRESPLEQDEEDMNNLAERAEEDLLEEFNSYSSKLALQADSRPLSEIRQADEATEFDEKGSGVIQNSRLVMLEETIKLEKNLEQLRLLR